MSKRQTTLTNFFSKTKKKLVDDDEGKEMKIEETTNNESKETARPRAQFTIKTTKAETTTKQQPTLPFLGLAETFENVEKESARLKKSEIISNYIQTVLKTNPSDLTDVLNLTTGQVAPLWEGKELGIGDGILKKVVQEITGLKQQQLNEKIKELGDIGIVAQRSKQNQKTLFPLKPLTIGHVSETLLNIVTADSTEIKKKQITSLLVAARGVEIKFLLRILKGVFRIGFTERSLPLAIATAIVSIKPPPKITRTDAIASLTQKITNTIARTPSFSLLSAALQSDDVEKALNENCGLHLLVPFRPMLAKPKKSVAEILSRFTFPFTCEYKYDGERGQIHYNKGDVKIFTRNLENYTSKYPDIISVIKKAVGENVQSCIIDGEIVAFDRETNEFREFQILGRRARKDVNIHSISVNVCYNVFDIVYLNGEDLMDKSLKDRREILHSSFNEIPQQFLFARYKDVSSEDDILPFFEEAVNARTEGLILKTLTTNANYIPDKRSDNWIKLKKDYLNGVGDTVDLVVIGAWKGEGKRKGVYGAYLVGCYNSDDDVFESVTKVGTGFSDEKLKTLYDTLSIIVCKQPTNVKHGSNLPDVWFQPKYVWEIKGADLSLSLVYRAANKKVALEKRGVCLRFPRFLKVRDDKEPIDATSHLQIYEMYNDQPAIGGKDFEVKTYTDNEGEEEEEEENGQSEEE
ncbi:DNA ligase [Entamoeba marina]